MPAPASVRVERVLGTAVLEQDGAEAADAEHAHRLPRLGGRAAEVRRENDVLELEQALVDLRLALVDVEGRARDLALAKSVDERSPRRRPGRGSC